MVWVLNNRYIYFHYKTTYFQDFKILIFFQIVFVNQHTQNICNKISKAMQWQLFLFSLDGIYSKKRIFKIDIFAPNVQNLLGRISFSSAVFVGWVTIFPTIILPCGLPISLPQPKYQENTRRPKMGQRKRNCILAGWCW